MSVTQGDLVRRSDLNIKIKAFLLNMRGVLYIFRILRYLHCFQTYLFALSIHSSFARIYMVNIRETGTHPGSHGFQFV